MLPQGKDFSTTGTKSCLFFYESYYIKMFTSLVGLRRQPNLPSSVFLTFATAPSQNQHRAILLLSNNKYSILVWAWALTVLNYQNIWWKLSNYNKNILQVFQVDNL